MKRYLVDTHAALWFCAGEQRRLGVAARRAFRELESGAAHVHISVVSLWEVAMLHDDGKIRLPAGYSAWCDALETALGLRVEALSRADVDLARTLPLLRDPHDRLIAGTSMRLSAALLSADRRIAADSRVRAVW